MDVGSALAHRLREQRVQHADDGRIVARFEQVFDLGNVLHQAAEIDVALDLADHARGLALAVGVRRAQARFELPGVDDDGRNLARERPPRFHDCGGRRRGSDPEHQPPVMLRRRQHRMGLGVSVGNEMLHRSRSLAA